MRAADPARSWWSWFVAALGVLLLAAVLIIGPPYAGVPSDDLRQYLYAGSRALILFLGFASRLLRVLPYKLRFKVRSAVLSVYSSGWRVAGTLGVIFASMMTAHVLTVLMVSTHPTEAVRGALETYGLDAAVMMWFAYHVAFHGRLVIQTERSQKEGALQTRGIWSHFFSGEGQCRVLLAAHEGSLFGFGTNAVRNLLQRRLEVLADLPSTAGADGEQLREISEFPIPRGKKSTDVAGHLDLRHPTIIVGGPKSNPATAAFLEDLASRYDADDASGLPLWKVDAVDDGTGHAGWLHPSSEMELGIHLEKQGFFLLRTPSASCAIVYFAWRGGLPLCVVAGHDANATEAAAKRVLNQDIKDVTLWSRNSGDEGIVEVWMRIENHSASVERVRRYSPKHASADTRSKRVFPGLRALLPPIAALPGLAYDQSDALIARIPTPRE
jgi:hypothetical protein